MESFIECMKTPFSPNIDPKASSAKKLIYFDFLLLNFFMMIIISTQQIFFEIPIAKYYILALFLLLFCVAFILKFIPISYAHHVKSMFSLILSISYMEIFGLEQRNTQFVLWNFCLFNIMIINDPIFWLHSLVIPIIGLYYLLRQNDQEFNIFSLGGVFLGCSYVLIKYMNSLKEITQRKQINKEIQDGLKYKTFLFEECSASMFILGLIKEKKNNYFSYEKIKRLILSKKPKKFINNSAKKKSKNEKLSKLLVQELNCHTKENYGDISIPSKFIEFFENIHIIYDPIINLDENIPQCVSCLKFPDFSDLEQQQFQLQTLLTTILEAQQHSKIPNYLNNPKLLRVLFNNPSEIDKQRKIQIKIIPMTDKLLIMMEELNEKSIDEQNFPDSLHNHTKLSEELEELKKKDQMKDQLFASISHDMRSPLNGITYYIKSAKETENTLLRAQKLDYALMNSSMLLFLINDLLDFSQFKNNSKIKPNLSKFHLNNLIEEITSLVKIEADNKGISLILQNECHNNILLMSDERRMKQVLINLLTNAIKFTFQGFVKIKISPIPNSDNIIKFEVIDTGLGIKKEVLPCLMKPFATFDLPDRKVNKNGIGLGLFICKTLVGLLGPSSNLFIYSEEGKGTKFGFLAYIMNEINHKKVELAEDYNIDMHFEKSLEFYQEENALESDQREFMIKARNISSKAFYNKMFTGTTSTYSKKTRSSRKNKILNYVHSNSHVSFPILSVVSERTINDSAKLIIF